MSPIISEEELFSPENDNAQSCTDMDQWHNDMQHNWWDECISTTSASRIEIGPPKTLLEALIQERVADYIVDLKMSDDYSPLSRALLDENNDSFIESLNRCSNVIRDTLLEGNSEFHVAVEFGDAEFVQRMINAGADIEELGEQCIHPLHTAAYNSLDSIALVLLQAVANVDAMDGLGCTPLQTAASNPLATVEIIRLLCSWGCSLEPLKPDSTPALFRAIMNDSVPIVDYLLSCGADVNSQDPNGMTPLEDAIGWASFDVIVCLLRWNARIYPSFTCTDGTLFQLASDRQFYDIGPLFLDAGVLMSREAWFFKNQLPDSVKTDRCAMQEIAHQGMSRM